MHFTSEQDLGDGVTEREFVLGEVPGILWTPEPTSATVPLVLLGQPGGLQGMYPRLLGRAKHLTARGIAAATTELPGSGNRPPVPALDESRADLRRALATGEPVDAIVERLVLPLVEMTVPEWRATLDALLSTPGIDGPTGISGGIIAIGIRMALVEPRIAAAGFFAGSFVPRVILEEARLLTVPLHVLLQWDDEDNDRQATLELFDAFGSREKTLQANMGGHAGVPPYAAEDASRFFERHLGR